MSVSTSTYGAVRPARLRAPFSQVIIFFVMLGCVLIPSPLNFPAAPSQAHTAAFSAEKQQGSAIAPPVAAADHAASPTKTVGTEGGMSSSSSPSKPMSATSSPPSGMEKCRHILLFSAPRHGSTWFLDSVEKCAYTIRNESKGTFGNLNGHTEIWNKGQKGRVLSILPDDAIDYVQSNMSLKFFPSPWTHRQDDAMYIVSNAHKKGSPVAILTREIDEAFKSLVTAQQTHQWNNNANSVDSTDTEVEIEEEQLSHFKGRLQRYFASVRETLTTAGIPFDELDYDDIVKREFIVLNANGCYVHNCNFK